MTLAVMLTMNEHKSWQHSENQKNEHQLVVEAATATTKYDKQQTQTIKKFMHGTKN